MPVYVDPLMHHGTSTSPRCFRNATSCHMYADTLEELHVMADRIGLLRVWFQNNPHLPHYDLVESRRKIAVKLGAVEQDKYDMVNFMRRRRGAEPLKRPEPV